MNPRQWVKNRRPRGKGRITQEQINLALAAYQGEIVTLPAEIVFRDLSATTPDMRIYWRHVGPMEDDCWKHIGIS